MMDATPDVLGWVTADTKSPGKESLTRKQY